MGSRRNFTAEFKLKVVLELLTGTKSTAAICREHSLKADLPLRWRELFLQRAPQVFQFQNGQGHEQTRIAELERLVGRQAMELEILKRGSCSLASLRSSDER